MLDLAGTGTERALSLSPLSSLLSPSLPLFLSLLRHHALTLNDVPLTLSLSRSHALTLTLALSHSLTLTDHQEAKLRIA